MELVWFFRVIFSYYISIDNLKKNCFDIGRKLIVFLMSDVVYGSLCVLFFLIW